MSIITWPATLKPGELSIGQARFDMVETSDITGHESARLLGPPRWRASIASPGAAVPADQADLWQSLQLRMRGKVNRLALWDVMRPVPKGTLRGSPLLFSDAAAGATSMQMADFGSVAAGDWLGLGSGIGTSQLVQVVESAVSVGGLLTVTFEPPLRRAYPTGTAVRWDRPVAYYRLTQETANWRYLPGGTLRAGYALDLIEAFA